MGLDIMTTYKVIDSNGHTIIEIEGEVMEHKRLCVNSGDCDIVIDNRIRIYNVTRIEENFIYLRCDRNCL